MYFFFDEHHLDEKWTRRRGRYGLSCRLLDQSQVLVGPPQDGVEDRTFVHPLRILCNRSRFQHPLWQNKLFESLLWIVYMFLFKTTNKRE